MRVRAVHKYETEQVIIYVREADMALVHEGGLERWEKVPEGGYAPAYLTIRADLAGYLIAALEEGGAPEPATRAHLKDAIAVRDRLLTMVEKIQR